MPPTRKSKKRDAIFEVLRSTKSHPSAEWIYRQLKDTIPDLSLGTVYRNLALFKEEQQAICVASVGGQDRFDARVEPHAHFICRSCGEVLDVDNVDIPANPDPDVVVEGYQLNYYGLCRQCQHSAQAQA